MPREDEPYYGSGPYAEERRRMDALPERERWRPIDPSTKQGLDRLRTPVPRIQRELYELIGGGPPSFPVSEAYARPMDDFGYAEEYTDPPILLSPLDALEVLRSLGFTLDMGDD
jgi:hypothetical protein